MSVLRYLFKLLVAFAALSLTFVVVLLVVPSVPELYRDLRGIVNRAVVARRVSPADAPPFPIGREAARSRRVLIADARHLMVDVEPWRILRTTDVWIERHGRDEYLLVSGDKYLQARSRDNRVMALRMADGRTVRLLRHTFPTGVRVVFARFGFPPPDSLLVVQVPVDSSALAIQ